MIGLQKHGEVKIGTLGCLALHYMIVDRDEIIHSMGVIP